MDVTDVENPSAVWSELGTDATFLAQGGNHLVVSDAAYGVRIYDLSDPGHPIRVGTVEMLRWATEIHIKNGYAFVSAPRHRPRYTPPDKA